MNAIKLHIKCRNTAKPYLRSKIVRQFVPDDKVAWSTVFPQYDPPSYTATAVFASTSSWADPPDPRPIFFNTVDDKHVNRISHHGSYSLSDDGFPLNPFGRTGLKGRGLLGKWAVNQAVDPIVSRFFRGQLQFVAVCRRDTGEFAIPGGMVDNDEHVSEALKREFTEEALSGCFSVDFLSEFWKTGHKIYSGYIDDHRNTDNAWIETTAVNFHDHSRLFENISLKAGDDAAEVFWVDVKPGLQLYASHEGLIAELALFHDVPFKN